VSTRRRTELVLIPMAMAMAAAVQCVDSPGDGAIISATMR
jgi:hypothetical protein